MRPLNSPEFNPPDHYVKENIRSQSQVYSVQKLRHRRIQGNAENDSLAQDTVHRAVKEFY